MARMAQAGSPAKPSGNSLIWLGGVGCGVVATVATPTALLVGVLLCPVVLARVCDPRPNRQALRPMLLMGIAGTLHPLVALWRAGHTMDIAAALLTDASVPATAWAAQAGGWLLGELMPPLVTFVMEARSRGRAAALRATRARFEAEWEIQPLSDT